MTRGTIESREGENHLIAQLIHMPTTFTFRGPFTDHCVRRELQDSLVIPHTAIQSLFAPDRIDDMLLFLRRLLIAPEDAGPFRSKLLNEVEAELFVGQGPNERCCTAWRSRQGCDPERFDP